MSGQELDLSQYRIGEKQLSNLAAEFYGTVMYPAGDHEVAQIMFEDNREVLPSELHAQFLKALACYRRA